MQASAKSYNLLNLWFRLLAHLCPFEGGNGVLKARILWMHWQPNALWDDRVLCMQGLNKNQQNSITDIDSLNSETIKQSNLQIGQLGISTINSIAKQSSLTDKIEGVRVYPNPANSYVIISYKTEVNGLFTLYNTLGEIVFKTELSSENTKTQIPLFDLANGVYHYEVAFASMKKTIGKLSILR
jgi:hypothetical protein